MKAKLGEVLAGVLIASLIATGVAPAQVPAPPPADQAAPRPAPEQLSQMLAPVALYPDSLLAQILMASTYPLEVVQADRWLQDPVNAALRGDELQAALDQQSWDPSIKSLVEFPRILRMMDQNLDWTERLGDAFLADQAAVMDSVQHLRRLARTAGKLQTTPQQVVTASDEAITIEPVSPQIVYVPVYDPSVVYGVWGWPGYPPYYFPGFYDGVMFDGFGFGWFGVPIFAPFWGWDSWDWGRHRIRVDPGRFAALNRNHASIGGDSWRHDSFHRRGVPYADAATSDRFASAVRSAGGQRSLRGFADSPGAAAPLRAAPGAALRGDAPPAFTRDRAAPIERVPPVSESYGSGLDARAEAARGYSSRMSSPGVSAGRGAPSGGGRSAGGGGRGPR